MSPQRRNPGHRWVGAALALTLAAGGLTTACSGDVARGGADDGDDGHVGSGGGGRGYKKPSGACPLEMPMRRLTNQQYRNSVNEIFGGVVAASALFPKGELGSSATGFSTEPAVNVVTKLGAENVLESAEEVALAVVGKLGELLPCAGAGAGEDCARTFIDEYGLRAYRRPLTDAEKTTLLATFKQGDGRFDLGIALVVSAMLQSPQFLYIAEAGTSADGEERALSDFEIASRLSFALWDGAPDRDLLRAAEAGELHEPAQIRAQAERMLDDERTRATLHRFATEWLELVPLTGQDRAGFSDELAEAQTRELDLFIQEAFIGSGSLRSLLTTRETFADRRLADYYGLDAADMQDGEFRAVSLEQPERSGLLTLPAVMTNKAHADEPAYVFRGTFVLEKMMCQDLPIPPPGAAQRLPDFPADATQREKSALIRGVSECGGCHALIDPIGLSFEGFDEIGRVRTELPGGQPVDSAGEVTGIDESLDGAFASPAELGERLAGSPTVERCMARQMLRFAFSRKDDDGGADTCAIDDLVYRYGTADQSLRELLLAVTQLEGFQVRKLAGEQP